jgi:glycosyltransferase involved in cell wall biosynthesis
LTTPGSRPAERLRLGLVVPRYGLDILGGAETFARNFAEHLSASSDGSSPGAGIDRPVDVTVLTTCARDLVTWQNEYPPGETRINGLRVLRFPVDNKRRNVSLYRELTGRINRGEPIGLEDQAAWLEHSAHSPRLYQHLAREGTDYDLFIFLPYLFGTTLYGSAVRPQKSVICPCLHDEPYAHFTDVRLAMQKVQGLMFISAPERALAEQKLSIRHPAARLVGCGLEEFSADGERFRQKYGLSGPFILYAGRLDPLKNVLQLLSFFLAYRQTHSYPDLKLVLAGSGPLPIPAHPDVVQLPSLRWNGLQDAYAAATLLCQPSLVESFSLVLMEAWLAGTPALVHGHCPVTRHHVLRSNGGLYFTSAAEFAGAVSWLLDHPVERQRMAMLGGAYVRCEFSWPATLARFQQALDQWLV